MAAFTRLTSPAAAMPVADIDTDIIFPARFLLITAKAGLGQYAFYEWRVDADGARRSDFVLNRSPFDRAEILIAGRNFGCGSSREQAPWALLDLGIRCVIAPSFGEIFFSNCLRNGMLPVVLDQAVVDRLVVDAEAGRALTVDLERRAVITASGEAIAFDIDPWRREALLNGWDEVALTLNTDIPAIARFEAAQRGQMAWLYAGE